MQQRQGSKRSTRGSSFQVNDRDRESEQVPLILDSDRGKISI